jgi:hypothetical protein
MKVSEKNTAFHFRPPLPRGEFSWDPCSWVLRNYERSPLRLVGMEGNSSRWEIVSETTPAGQPLHSLPRLIGEGN